MTTFPQLDRHQSEVDGAKIDLPVRGKVYSFPTALPFGLGLRMTVIGAEAHRIKAALAAKREYQVKDEARALVDDVALHELYRDLIGPEMWAQMESDGVKWPEVLHVGETLFAFHQAGEDAAMMVWMLPETDEDATEGDAVPPSQKPAKPSSSSRPKTSQSSSTAKKPRIPKASK